MKFSTRLFKGIRFGWLALLNLLAVVSTAQNFTWAKTDSGPSHSGGLAITTDAGGNVYYTGYFQGTVDFDPGPGSFTMSCITGRDIFISKTDVNGSFLWAKSLGATSSQISFPSNEGDAIELDSLGNLYATGSFSGTADFDPGPGTFNLSSYTGYQNDIFILKLDANGNFMWAAALGGSGSDAGRSLGFDPLGNSYITGFFETTVDFDPGPSTYTMSSSFNQAAFILKLGPTGNFIWAKSIESYSYSVSEARSIVYDPSGNIYLTGFYQGTVDFDPGTTSSTQTSFPDAFGYPTRDVFVMKLDTSGNFIWAKSFGGADDELARAIAGDGSGNVCAIGLFADTVDFDPGPAIYNQTGIGHFILKLTGAGNFVWVKSVAGVVSGADITTDSFGNLLISGVFNGTVDFDPGPSTNTLVSANSLGGDQDYFILKLDAYGNFNWVKQLKSGLGFDGDTHYPISLDASGGIYTTGIFAQTTDFDPGPGVYSLTAPSTGNIFLLKLACISPSAANPVSGATLVCEGDSSLYSTQAVGSATSYAWYTSSGLILPGSTTLSVSVPFGAVQETVTVHPVNVCGNGSGSSLVVTVDPAPPIVPQASPSFSVCSGSSLTLSGTGAVTYTWSNGIINNIAFTPLATSVFTVTGTYANGCLTSGAGTATVVVNTLPNVNAVALPAYTLCLGSLLSLSGTGASTYAWSGGVSDNVSFFPGSTSDYTVTGTDVNGCVNSRTLAITLNPLPVLGSTAIPSATLCSGAALSLSGTGALTYTWSSGVLDGVFFLPTSSSTYSLSGTDLNGCTNTITSSVVVNVSPVISLQPFSQTLIIGATAQFSALCSDPNALGQWYQNTGSGFIALSNTAPYSGVTTATLIITNVSLLQDNFVFRRVVTDGNCSDTSTVALLNVYDAMGIDELTVENGFQIYPNPATDYVQLQVNTSLIGLSYSLCDQTGRWVMEGRVNAYSNLVNITSLSKGLYFIRVGDQNQKPVKIIKQ